MDSKLHILDLGFHIGVLNFNDERGRIQERFVYWGDKKGDLGDLARTCARLEIDGGWVFKRKFRRRGKGGGGSHR